MSAPAINTLTSIILATIRISAASRAGAAVEGSGGAGPKEIAVAAEAACAAILVATPELTATVQLTGLKTDLLFKVSLDECVDKENAQ